MRISNDNVNYILEDSIPQDWQRTGTSSNRRYKLSASGKEKFGFDYEISRRAYDQYVGRVKTAFQGTGRKATLERFAEENLGKGTGLKPARGRTKEQIRNSPNAYIKRGELFYYTDDWIAYENGYYKDFQTKSEMLGFVSWLKSNHPDFEIRIMKYVREHREYNENNKEVSEGYATAYPTTGVLQFQSSKLRIFPSHKFSNEYIAKERERILEENKQYLTPEEYQRGKEGKLKILVKPLESNLYINPSPFYRIDWYSTPHNRQTALWRVYFAKRNPVQIIGEGIMPRAQSPITGRRNLFIETVKRKNDNT